MKRYVLMCFASGLAGAAVAIAVSGRNPDPAALAQPAAPVDGYRRPARPGNPQLPNRTVVSAPPVAPITVSDIDALRRLPGDGEFAADERVNIAVYEKVNRSVVNITTRSVRPDAFMMMQVPAEGAGSGSVLDREGRILTNHHVIDGAREIQVTEDKA